MHICPRKITDMIEWKGINYESNKKTKRDCASAPFSLTNILAVTGLTFLKIFHKISATILICIDENLNLVTKKISCVQHRIEILFGYYWCVASTDFMLGNLTNHKYSTLFVRVVLHKHYSKSTVSKLSCENIIIDFFSKRF